MNSLQLLFYEMIELLLGNRDTIQCATKVRKTEKERHQ